MRASTSTAKRTIVFFVASLLVVSALGTVPMSVLAQADQPNEPNDIREVVSPIESAQVNNSIRKNATPIEDGQITGKINSTDDVDWYSFQASVGETSILFTKPVNAPRLRFVLYASDHSLTPNNVILSEDPAMSDTRTQAVFTATATDTYYIKIQLDKPRRTRLKSMNGSYTLYIFDESTQSSLPMTPTDPQQDREPNDIPPAGTSLDGTQVTGKIAVRGGTDWYTIQATAGETISVVLSKPAAAAETHIKLYEPVSGSLVDKDIVLVGYRKAKVSATADVTGTYYVKIGAPLSNSNISYTLYTLGNTASETPTPTAPATDSPPSTTVTLADTSTVTATSTPTLTPTLTKTPTATQTTTTTASGSRNTTSGSNASGSGEAIGNTTETTDDGGTDMFGPGFGTIGAIIALLAAALFAVRRQ